MSLRQEKSYSGTLMDIGTKNEERVLMWLKGMAKDIIDFREFRLAQRIDVDFGIETIDGNIVLAEIKSDKHINDFGNLLFECNRINHFVDGKWFYLGWGWRSPAQKLIIRNPDSSNTYVFDFLELRRRVAKYISENGKKLRLAIVETDNQKTTFNYLVPLKYFNGIYRKFSVE